MIRRILASPFCDSAMLEALRVDPRAEVAELLDAAERRDVRMEEERGRHEEMLAIENELRAAGHTLIAGVDEAGVGPQLHWLPSHSTRPFGGGPGRARLPK